MGLVIVAIFFGLLALVLVSCCLPGPMNSARVEHYTTKTIIPQLRQAPALTAKAAQDFIDHLEFGVSTTRTLSTCADSGTLT